MANTYSSSLRLIIQQDGTNQGTWGGYTNTNIASLIEQAITGVGNITVSGSSNYTLTVTNGASDEARNAILNITGTLTAAINVICPTAAKTYIVKNGTTGGFAITLKTSAGTGISVPNGSTALLYCNGTSVVEGVNYSSGFTAANLTYTGALTGGTGVVNIGSGQIYKDSSGNVGIGTSSPGANLDINGTLRVSGDSSFTSTGAVLLSKGTTAERPTGVAGKVRFNTTLTQFEGYNGTSWGTIGGGATGGGSDQVFYENGKTVTTSYSITSGKCASSTGPITINSGVTVTIPSGSRWVIL